MEENPPLDRAAHQLIHRLEGAVQRSLRMVNEFAIFYPGGLDSTILAAVARRISDVPVLLVAVRYPGGPSAQRARRAASHLRLSLLERRVGEAEHARARDAVRAILADAGRIPKADLDFLVPLHHAAREVRSHAERMLIPRGVSELFAGAPEYTDVPADGLQARLDADLARYQGHLRPLEERIGKHHGVQFRYPYLDRGIVGWAQRLSLEAKIDLAGDTKAVVRRVGQLLGLPDEVFELLPDVPRLPPGKGHWPAGGEGAGRPA